MRRIYNKSFMLLMMLMALFCQVALAGTVSIPTTSKTYFDWNDATLTNCKVENSGANIGSTRNGSTAVFTLDNANKMDYMLTFMSGASNLTATLNVAITNASGTELFNEDFEISNTGSWTPSEVHTAQISKLETGTLTMTMTIKKTSGSYAGNYGKLAVYSLDDYYAAYPQVPSDTYFPLNDNAYASYSGCQYESGNQNVGYIKSGTSATYTFYAAQTAYYNLAMGISKYDGGTIKATVTDVATGATECSGEFEIPSSSNYTAQSFEFTDPITTKGVKKMLLEFSNTTSGWVMNYKNVTLTKRAPYGDQGTMYNVSCSQNLDEAGTVTQSPSSAQIEAGSNVKFTATPNFGYHFVKWVDANGDDVSTDNPYKVAVNSDIAVKAIFEKVATYQFTLNVEGGYEDMITISPSPTTVDGKYMYEAGTDVSLTASENEAVTFNYWSDGTTNKTLSFTMDADKTVTATYANGNYVVAWDLHKSVGTSSSYKADFYSTTENNEASLYARMIADETVTTQASTTNYTVDQERGIWFRDGGNAVIWGLPVKCAYEFKYNAENFKDMSFKADLWYSYNYWEKVQLQCSTDRATWTDVSDPITMTSGQKTYEWTLPSTLNHQSAVYLRLLPDLTSQILGSGSDYRPIWMDNVYVFGQEEAKDDGTAPKYVSSVPANEATGASATGRIVLNFDEKLKAADTFSATLNGEKISGTIAGKTVVFAYSGLKYNTKYSFSLAAGSVSDMAGNICNDAVELSFTTMQRTQPDARLYDAIVAQDGSGDYTTVKEALDAAPSSCTKPWLIFVKAGTYEEQIFVTKPFMHLIGEGRDKVTFTWYGLSGGLGDDLKAQAATKGQKYIETGETGSDASFQVQATDCYVEGITLENSWGYNMLNGPQALAVKAVKDRAIFNKVEMRSYQDTYFSSPQTGRQYIKDSWITGAVDFIYGNGNVYFDKDTININRQSGGWVVAPNHDSSCKWGYVFQNSLITTTYTKNPEDYSISLGRPWHANPETVFLNTKMEVSPVDSLWSTWGGLPTIWAVYNLTDKYDNPRTAVSRHIYYNDTTPYWECKNTLTDEEAAQYTIANVLRGDDDWLPEQICEATDAPVIATADGKITWDAVPYAICYAVLKDGMVESFTIQTSIAPESGATYSVKACSEYGALSNASNSVSYTPTAVCLPQVSATVVGSEAYYNVAGQRVGKDAKGIILHDGKKMIK